jgi:putative nucleotidyltransferase with HDIG domain
VNLALSVRGEARRRSVEEQLHRLRVRLNYELLAVSDEHGEVVGALIGNDSATAKLASGGVVLANSDVEDLDGTLYETITVPIQTDSGRGASLTVGSRFDLNAFQNLGDTALVREGRVVLSTLAPAQNAEIERQLRPVCVHTGCDLRIGAQEYLATPVARGASGLSLGQPYQLLSFQSVDQATDSLSRGFQLILPVIGACGALASIWISLLVSRVIGKPLKQMAARLEQSEASGLLLDDFPVNSPTDEVNQLAASLNRAARALRHSQGQLDNVYLEFVETMAQALDARDPYTAGHSIRVSTYAVSIAKEMQLGSGDIEIIRIGALMHDIGKIGIPDLLLQKPGYLTPEEFEIIKLHPQIGKRILERVGQFGKYLPIVELHHEDHDGRGYPYGLSGNEIPLGVRIVHVADVFDALTSYRAYRNAMPPAHALETIVNCSGTQFDSEVVSAFVSVLAAGGVPELICLEQFVHTPVLPA